MQKISHCLDVFKSKASFESASINQDLSDSYEVLISQNELFVDFIKPLNFENFLLNYTIKKTDTLKIESEDLESMEYVEDTNRLALSLSNSITDPKVIELITQNLLKNQI
jgi:hypothetical protein